MDYEYEDETERICFEFLDELRKSGITNMFGGVEFLQEFAGIENKAEARYILTKWMKTFVKRGCPGRDEK